jgi:hypothetical protein
MITEQTFQKGRRKSVEDLQGQVGGLPQASFAEGAGGDGEAEDGVVEEAGEGDRILVLGNLALALGGAQPGGERGPRSRGRASWARARVSASCGACSTMELTMKQPGEPLLQLPVMMPSNNAVRTSRTGASSVELAADAVEGAIEVALEGGVVEGLLVAVGVVEALAADAEFARSGRQTTCA